MCRSGLAATRLNFISPFTRRLRTGLTSPPPLRGLFGRLSWALFQYNLHFATQAPPNSFTLNYFGWPPSPAHFSSSSSVAA